MYFVSEPSGAHGVAKATARESGRSGQATVLWWFDSRIVQIEQDSVLSVLFAGRCSLEPGRDLALDSSFFRKCYVVL